MLVPPASQPGLAGEARGDAAGQTSHVTPEEGRMGPGWCERDPSGGRVSHHPSPTVELQPDVLYAPLLGLEVHHGEVLVVSESHPDVGLGHSWGRGREPAELGAGPDAPCLSPRSREPARRPAPPPNALASPALLNCPSTAPLVKVLSVSWHPPSGLGRGPQRPELQPLPTAQPQWAS